jgi:hypothetical protein
MDDRETMEGRDHRKEQEMVKEREEGAVNR